MFGKIINPIWTLSNNYQRHVVRTLFLFVHNRTLQPNLAVPFSRHQKLSTAKRNLNDNEPLPNCQTNEHGLMPKGDVNRFTFRSHTCGQVNDQLLEQEVELCGWLEYQRLGKFVVLRDSYGSVQLIVLNSKIQHLVKNINLESVIRVKGKVVLRPAKDVNLNMKNGNIEILVNELTLLNNSMPNMPILPRNSVNITEQNRLQYRYIDLRRAKMIQNLRLRSSFIMGMRNCLVDQFGFVEVETPTLFKATPGGAQEFIVPTRFPNHFYSLVQSPQQFKQLLMIGGIDRYFQIARCYRDEGTKSDRQPEFTQLDIEMSFTSMNNVIELVEHVLRECWPVLEERSQLSGPFDHIKYEDAMNKFGCDKPDLRSDIEIKPLIDANSSLDGNETYLLVIPQEYDETFAIKEFINDELSVQINTLKFKGQLNYFKFSSMAFQQNLDTNILDILNQDLEFKANDFLWVASGSKADCLRMLGRIRAQCIDKIENARISNGHQRKLSTLWVYDFPLFLENEETGQLESSHHPFTAPKPSDKELIYTDPAKVIGQSFDLVVNGREMGGGSIRIEDPALQRYIMRDILRCDFASMEYFFDALHSGCPPHGGFAIGLDRLIALICSEPSLRDVIAFPKAAQGKDFMASSPNVISNEVKQLYHLLPASK